jgi:hypothetical protein
VCPAMLRDKWRRELTNRFGVQAEIVDANELHDRLLEAKEKPQTSFALIASVQGLRPRFSQRSDGGSGRSSSSKLSKFLEETEENAEDPLLDLVVIDEAHYLKNESTANHRLGRQLRPVCLNMVMLSATPIQLRSTDLFNLLHLLDEDAFPYSGSFEHLLRANAPVVRLRDRLLRAGVSHGDFIESIKLLSEHPHFKENQQLRYLIEQPPSAEYLESPKGRSEIADRLDRLNPLTKVVTRTLKRDVGEVQVIREPVLIHAVMTAPEEEFYTAVTAAVRAYCERRVLTEGFLLTIPQRQMSSSMAAACQGWQQRYEKERDALAESLYELDADDLSGVDVDRLEPDGPLIAQLVSIARRVGDFRELSRNDSKYQTLIDALRSYWKARARKKVVLFSFYRHTLYYLQKRLEQDGIASVVLHGGMDKQEALDHFASDRGPDILLSSEVAAEGVDLQFSSLLINYDLPWNPAKIEQRIGRIDRIGQQESKILIWNLVYANTIDDRVCTRLLERLNTFERALGSMEAILGQEIRQLSYELLSHDLTPAQEQDRIDRTRIAIENVTRQQTVLEEEATTLLAHGDFIQNKVKAANELGRYIRGTDLLGFIRDYMMRAYPGTRMTQDSTGDALYRIELSTEARVDLTEFIQDHRLQGRTAILAASPPKVLFENRLGATPAGVERVTQDHPLTRFVTRKLSASGGAEGYMPVTACQLSAADAGVPPDDYVYVVSRWSFSGSREIERLEYAVKGIRRDRFIDTDRAEQLVNLAALDGKDWIGAAGDLDNHKAAQLQDECRAELEEAFIRFRETYQREDADRIALMVRTLQHHFERKRDRLNERIQRLTEIGSDSQRRILPLLKGQLRKEEAKIEQRIAELRVKAKVSAQDTVVSSGVIRVR